MSTVAAAAGVSEAPVAANPDTGVTKDLMVEVGKASVAVLEGFVSVVLLSIGDGADWVRWRIGDSPASAEACEAKGSDSRCWQGY